MTRLSWAPILERAAAIVRSYDTGVTLRQLFYQLVSKQIIPNTVAAYHVLSRETAAARRLGEFPDLIEGGRVIYQPETFDGPDDARAWLRSIYRRDRTEGQACRIILGVEKAGIVEQLQSWFGDLGVPIVATSGYASQTLEAKLDAFADKSTNVLIYAGDFDPTGEDIIRNLAGNLASIAVEQIALTPDQVRAYDLPENPGKSKDPRSPGFVAKHGRLVQVELDALDPNVLRGLYQDAIDQYWDEGAFQRSLDQEAADREELE